MNALRLAFGAASSGGDFDWEEADCPLCGGDRWSPILEAPDHGGSGLRFLVVRCQDCGLAFTNPRPSPASIGRFYDDDYKPHHKKVEADSGPAPWWRRFLPFRASPRKVLPLEGQGRLLDFGCGGGSFLIRMRRLGWNVTGLDFSSAVVDRLRATHGLTVHQGSLPHADLPDESFDVITMWESLEHVHQPLDVLRAAQRLLAKGGKILVSLHNIESVAFRWFGPAWFPLDLPRHLTHFSPSTLRLALHEAGFQPGRVRMLRSSSWLRKSADIAKAYPTLSGAWMRMLRSRLGSNLASWYCYLTRAADSMLVIGQKAA